MMTVDVLVSVEWLLDRLENSEVQIIDGSWYIPGGPSGLANFHEKHIPGAIHVDIDILADPKPGPPNRMLPSPEDFAHLAGEVGLSPNKHIIVYDQQGLYSAARIWWMLRTYGHDRVSVLDGGLPAWEKAGGPLISGGQPHVKTTNWPVSAPLDYVRSWQEVLENITDQKAQLVDVRLESMFNGDTSSHYPGVRPGHIPGAVNMPQKMLFADGKMGSQEHIEACLDARGIDIEAPIIATCGSGVTACILSLAMAHAGRELCPVYEGSWEEWGARHDLPNEIEEIQDTA